MRYATAGDWYVNQNGDLIVESLGVNPFEDDDGFLIALHELIEAKLCHKRGIPAEAVDEFDFAFKGIGEPGDAPDCPYRKEHRQAMLVEHLVANLLGLDRYGEIR